MDVDSSDTNLRELASLLTNNADPVTLGFAVDISYEEIVPGSWRGTLREV